MPNEIFAERIKKYRTEKGYTQAELAEIIGISTVNCAKYESGKRSPSLPTLVKISLALEKPLECFLYENRDGLFLADSQLNHLRSLSSSQLRAILEQLQKLYQSQK